MSQFYIEVTQSTFDNICKILNGASGYNITLKQRQKVNEILKSYRRSNNHPKWLKRYRTATSIQWERSLLIRGLQ